MSAAAELTGAAIDPGGWAPYLDPGEMLLWEGGPATGIKFRKSDLFMIPFSLAWGGFAIFWEVSVIALGAPVIMAIFGLPFVAIGLYMIFGRFLWDAHKRARTRYALTDKRAIIATRYQGRQMKSHPIDPAAPIAYDAGPEASIVFDRRMRGSGKGRRLVTTGFEFIPDGERVYRLIRAIQRAAEERDT